MNRTAGEGALSPVVTSLMGRLVVDPNEMPIHPRLRGPITTILPPGILETLRCYLSTQVLRVTIKSMGARLPSFQGGTDGSRERRDEVREAMPNSPTKIMECAERVARNDGEVGNRPTGAAVGVIDRVATLRTQISAKYHCSESCLAIPRST